METAFPVDWYRTSFAPNYHSLYWEEGGEDKAVLALEMLRPKGEEAILDLACATGRRSLELARHGFETLGVDVRPELLEVAACEAEQGKLPCTFHEEDTRYLDLVPEYDIVLSLGGGAFEHFDYDEENQRAFAAAARALRPGGRLLMQVPNVLRVEAQLPEEVLIETEGAEEAIVQHWNAPTRRLEGTRASYLAEEPDEEPDPVPFERRLYDIEELAEIFNSLGLALSDVFDEHGRRCAPSEAQQELYVEARA